MTTTEKQALVAEVAETLSNANSVFLADFTGLNVEEANSVRREFKKASVEYKVVKNTLARLSFKQAGHDELLEFLEGPTAVAFGMDDPAAPAKVLNDLGKTSEKIRVKACLFEGVLIGSDKLSDLASLPSKEEIIGKLAATLNAPLYKLAYALNGCMTNLVFALEAVRKQKEENK